MISKAREQDHISAIDGLRAIAVLAIMAYHLDATWLPGGFVGVDIFFVISGFVVTKSVDSAHSNTLPDYFLWFYRRRILRIIPALVAFVLVTTLLSVLFIPLGPGSKVVEITGASSLFGLSNFVILWKTGDYFATASTFNPFTHTWSLGVEEQYYLLFPFFSYFIFVSRKASEHARQTVVVILAAACVLSLALCVAASSGWNDVAFYMLPTRFWQLGLGFFLCLGLKNSKSHNQFIRAVNMLNRLSLLATLSLAAIVLGLFICNEKRFPFPWALLPCFATAGLIASTASDRKSLVHQLLAHPFVVGIGKISYSLYLWHWGVICLMRWTVGDESFSLKLLAILIMTSLSLGSYYCIERPLRYNFRLGTLNVSKFYLTFGCALLAASFLCGVLFIVKPKIGLFASADSQTWSPYTYPPPKMGNCQVTKGLEGWSDGRSVISFTPKECTKSKANGISLFVMGDSHAGAYERMLHRLAAEDGYSVRVYTLASCNLIDYFDTEIPPSCPSFRAKSIKEIAREARPRDILFLTGLYIQRYRESYDTGGILKTSDIDLSIRPEDHLAAEQVLQTLQPLRLKGLRIILEAPKPLVKSAPFRCADWFNRISNYCSTATDTPREELLHRRSRVYAFLQDISLRSDAVMLWDPFFVLCPGDVCRGYMEGKPLYMDTDHLSGFSNDLIYPEFKKAISADSK